MNAHERVGNKSEGRPLTGGVGVSRFDITVDCSDNQWRSIQRGGLGIRTFNDFLIDPSPVDCVDGRRRKRPP